MRRILVSAPCGLILQTLQSLGGFADKGDYNDLAERLSYSNRLKGLSRDRINKELERMADSQRQYFKTADRQFVSGESRIVSVVLNAHYHDGTGQRRVYAPVIGASTYDGKQIPAHLPDSMCSPVTVRRIEPHPVQTTTTKEVNSMTPGVKPAVVDYRERFTRKVDLSVPEKLTLALQILQAAADEQGNITAPKGGTTKLLTDGLATVGGTKFIASNLRAELSSFGLFSAKYHGRGEYSYWVDMSVREITDESLAEYRRQARAKADGQSLPVVVPDSSQVDDLADTVETLAAALDMLGNEHAACESRTASLEARIRNLEQKNAQLTRENEQLKTAAQATHARAAQLVARYGAGAKSH